MFDSFNQPRRANIKKSPCQAMSAVAIAAKAILPSSQISGSEGAAESDPIKTAATAAAVARDHRGIAPNRMIGPLAPRITIAVAIDATAITPVGDRPAATAIVEKAETIRN
jgi:hypothetical protein